MKRVIKIIFCSISMLLLTFSLQAQLPSEIDDSWELTWSDEFDYQNEQLEEKWTSQNSPSSHILSGRYRDNVTVDNGVLELHYKKEQRNGQEWTSGNIWTNQEFNYGYFECRYKYAAAGATNNSFWIMNQSYNSITPPGRGFELDINEGHFPNEVNTNIHKFDEGFTNRTVDSKSYVFGIEAGVNLPLEIPITTNKIRFSSNNATHFHIREFRVFNDNNRNFPDPYSETADNDIAGLINHAKAEGTKISVSGTYNSDFGRQKENMVDGNVSLNSWVSQTLGEKWIEFEWPEEKTVGCIQFVNGWNGPDWKGIISDYLVEYWDGTKWVEMAKLDAVADNNFAEEYHTYGMSWDENEFVWYFDGEEIRRTPNTHAYGYAPLWLSGAIVDWSGPVTDAIDGTSMKVDYVRVYQRKIIPDELTEIDAVASVRQNEDVVAIVNYSTSTPRDIRVNFKDSAGIVYGSQIKTVSGIGSETFYIATNEPPLGSGYVLQAYMTPEGGNWTNRIGDPIQKTNIEVTESVVDALISIDGDESVEENAIITATVNYSTTTSRDIRVNFKGSNGVVYGSLIKTVNGAGSEIFNISTVNPPVGNDYVLQTYMTPEGGNWNNRIGEAIQKTNIEVTKAPIDALISINGDASVEQNATITATVNYSTAASRDIRVNFKSSNGTVYGSLIKTVNGAGSEIFNITTANPPLGNDYVLQTYMTPEGGNWNNRIVDPIEKTNIEVTAPPVDALITIVANSSFTQNETITATVNYSTVTARDIRVNFKSISGVVYGQQIKTVTGSGSETFSISSTNPPVASGYLLQAYMSPEGGNWGSRIGEPINKRNISIVSANGSNARSSILTSETIEDYETSLSLFPNPVDNKLHVKLNHVIENDAELFIYNSMGKLTFKINLSNKYQSITVSDFPQGLYFMKVVNGENILNKKFIKN